MNLVLAKVLKDLDRKTKFEIGGAEEAEAGMRETNGFFTVKKESVENVEKFLHEKFGGKLQPICKQSIPYKPIYQFKKSEELC